MSVARLDLNKCIGCGNCVKLCPMDVFYFDETENKSVMAYPENCQGCAQCYLHCLGGSLTMSTLQNSYSIGAGRALRTYASVLAEIEAASGDGEEAAADGEATETEEGEAAAS